MAQVARDIVSHVKAYAWPSVVAGSRRAILTLLSRVKVGQIVIVDNLTNVTTVCGALEPRRDDDEDLKGIKQPTEGPRAELRVQSNVFWVRLLLFADMGFAESYMLGEVTCEDLVSFFEVFIRNKEALSNATTFVSSMASSISYLARKTNSLANARLNISAHYDISNSMFAAFLSPDMTYSCPIWCPKHLEYSQNETLEGAQITKLRYCVYQARIKRQDHVLEIGTGWGSFAMEAVKLTGCRITSLTLSKEQKALAEERIRAAGLSDRIEVLLCDYRALPSSTEGYYDKIVSIEMLEAVGAEYLETYFQCVNRLLKPDGGIAVFQCITIPEQRYEVYSKSNDFIRQYIFPGGHLPTISQLIRSIDKGSDGSLVTEDVKNIGGYYAKTLRLWRQNFLDNFDTKIRPALEKEHKEMSEQDVDVFRRKWEYYFTYCEAGFRTKTLGDHIITVAREGTIEMLEDIPL